MKRNVIILIILAVIIIVLVAAVIIGKQPKEELPNISSMEVATQNNGGVMSTNYMPILEESIDWAALSDDERADIARDAVNAAIEQAEQNSVTSFNVMGLTQPLNEPIFLYTGGDSVFVYVNGEGTAIPFEG